MIGKLRYLIFIGVLFSGINTVFGQCPAGASPYYIRYYAGPPFKQTNEFICLKYVDTGGTYYVYDMSVCMNGSGEICDISDCIMNPGSGCSFSGPMSVWSTDGNLGEWLRMSEFLSENPF